MWKGLGYYSRAARLLAAAKKVVEELDGRLPDNAKDMEALIPGVGRYTAGAICSIAYNEQVPVVSWVVISSLASAQVYFFSSARWKRQSPDQPVSGNPRSPEK
jgi:adenine-specific DNA glycosylase